MTRLETASQLAIILVATVVVADKAYDWATRPPTEKARVAGFARRWIGKPLQLASTKGTRATIVLFVSPTCHYCSESMPFYGRLAAMRSREVRVVGALPSRDDGYFRGHGVDQVDVETVNFASLGLPSTPTVLLLDGGGVVRAIWNGKLEASAEDQVMGKIRQLQ